MWLHLHTWELQGPSVVLAGPTRTQHIGAAAVLLLYSQQVWWHSHRSPFKLAAFHSSPSLPFDWCCAPHRSGGTATVDPVKLAASTDEPEASAAAGQEEDGRISIVDMPGMSGEQTVGSPAAAAAGVLDLQPAVRPPHSPLAGSCLACMQPLHSFWWPERQPNTYLYIFSRCAGRSLLDIRELTLRVPSSGATLVQDLTLSVTPGERSGMLTLSHNAACVWGQEEAAAPRCAEWDAGTSTQRCLGLMRARGGSSGTRVQDVALLVAELLKK